MSPFFKHGFVGLLLTAALGATSCATSATQSNGVLVIAGGAVGADSPVWTRFLQEVEAARQRQGVDQATIEVVAAASSDPEGSLTHNVARIGQIADGPRVQGVRLHLQWPESANDLAIAERLRNAQGVWFSGGDQSRVTSLMPPRLFENDPEVEATEAARALQVQVQKGGVIGGTSAGAAIMSGRMLAGGRSENAVRFGIGEGGALVTEGMGWLPFGIVDQHFLARGRLGRLLVAMQHTGTALGMGVEENSAAVVGLGENPWIEGVGPHGVCLLEWQPSEATGKESGPPQAWNARLHLLGHGDCYWVNKARVQARQARVPVTTFGPAALDSASPWDEDAILNALLRLSRDPATPQVLESEYSRLVVEADEQTTFWVAPFQARDLCAAGVKLRLERREP